MEQNKKMNALVTGGAGFIGSNVVDILLKNNFSVTVIDDLSTGYVKNIDTNKVNFIEGDVRDYNLVLNATKNIDVVFHLAASIGNKKSIDNPVLDSEINVLGTLTVLESARINKVKTIVYSSSAAIFGELETTSIDENHPINPDSPYGVSKLSAEKQLLCYGKLYDIKVIALRYFNVFGERQRFDEYGNVIPIFAERIYNQKSMTIFGDGKQTRDFIHVKDVAMANYLAAVKSSVSGVYNVGSGQSITVNYLVEILTEITQNKQKPIYAEPRIGDVLHCKANISKIQQDLDFKPNLSIKEQLREYWEWFVNDKKSSK
ncbi:MAG: NAD-dependent epimerase/dehydratase family protein [Bacteroidales bacterium]|nr:NAD-dependent epimerase/dehydratase family protein [Bacteroidales bacterium]